MDFTCHLSTAVSSHVGAQRSGPQKPQEQAVVSMQSMAGRGWRS